MNARRKTTRSNERRSIGTMRRLNRFDELEVGHEFYHRAALFVKKSMSSATTAVTGRLQRFTPSTMVRPATHPRAAAEVSARQLAADAYHRFVEACDQLHV
jgi:hypothetical protein